MLVETYALPSLVNPENLAGKTVIVLDILRATTNIVTALANGCQEIIPTVTVEEAQVLAKRFPRTKIVLGGERHRVRIEGFDLGNSPKEYQGETVQGKVIIFTTTNGTRAIRSASSASPVLIGSFLNTKAVVDYSLALGQDIVILCSGTVGKFSLEDSVAAGYLISQLAQGEQKLRLDDLSLAVNQLYQSYADKLLQALWQSENGRSLVELGKEEDLAACVQLNIYPVIPYLQQGSIKLLSR